MKKIIRMVLCMFIFLPIMIGCFSTFGFFNGNNKTQDEEIISETPTSVGGGGGTSIINNNYPQENTEEQSVLPEEYKQVEYIHIRNNVVNYFQNGVSLDYAFCDADKIEIEMSTTDTHGQLTLLIGGSIHLTMGKNNKNWTFSGVTSWSTDYLGGDANLRDGEIKKITFDYSSTASSKIFFGSFQNTDYFSRSIKWYSFKLYKEEIVLCDLHPCCRIEDDVAGFYDVVNDKFFVNSGKGRFYTNENDVSYQEKYYQDEMASSFAGGDGTFEKPYLISSAKELSLMYFSNDYNSKGYYFELKNDIYLNEGHINKAHEYIGDKDGLLYFWTYFEHITGGFVGTLNGNGYTIYGLNGSLFRAINNSKIYNIKFKNSFFNGSSGITNTASNSEIKNVEFYGYGTQVNGFVGVLANSSISNCKNYIKLNGGFGIANQVNNFSKIDNCINYGDIIGSNSSGICGNVTNSTISNCVNYGNVNNGSGITRTLNNSVVTNCRNYGTTYDGISSDVRGSATINYCVNNGNVGFAGILGSAMTNANKVDINNCINYGDVLRNSDLTAGGIIGMGYSNGITIKNCINYGDVWSSSGYRPSSGFVGEGANVNIKIYDSINYGYCNDTKNSGYGFAPTATLIRCYDASDSKYMLKSGSATSCMTDEALLTATLTNCIDFKNMRAVGKDFRDFYWSWKTGKIGIKTLDGNGLFQGEVDLKYLYDKNFECEYLPEGEGGEDFFEVEFANIVNDSVNGYNNGITTGVKWCEADKIVLSCSASATNSKCLMIFRTEGTGAPYIAYSGQQLLCSGISATQSKALKLDEYTDGEKKETTYVYNSTNTGVIQYGFWQDSTWSGSSKLYSMKIYKGDNLIRDFIPVKRGVDGEVGLYDRVEGKFYENVGSGNFGAGRFI